MNVSSIDTELEALSLELSNQLSSVAHNPVLHVRGVYVLVTLIVCLLV
jgi:hypothetical protein